jgi:putative endonuclease
MVIRRGKLIDNFMWYVYILKCADRTFYTGITTDVKRRVREHNRSAIGAKYTRGRRPVKLVYSRRMKSRPLAAKEEFQIKKMSRTEKKSLTYPHIHRGKRRVGF